MRPSDGVDAPIMANRRWDRVVSAQLLPSELNTVSAILANAEVGINVSWPGCRAIVGKRSTGQDDSQVTLVFNSREECIATLGRPNLPALASAYLSGVMKIDGDIIKAMEAIEAINVASDRAQTLIERLKLSLFFLSKTLIPPSSQRFDSFDHYAKPASAYELMLGSRMQYTCGMYVTDKDDLESAQTQKIEFIRDLFMKYSGSLAGKLHLDVGCGWGGLMEFFERNLATSSVGITNSPQQKMYAESKFGVTAHFCDFESFKSIPMKYDYITIVGMIEHLTPCRRDRLLKFCRKNLASNGLVYVQCIQKPPKWIGGDAYRLTQKYVFPGHYLDTEAQTKDRFRKAGFEVLEQFEHSMHYALTTEAWVRNLEANHIKFRQIVGDREYRLFLGYLALASQMFRRNRGSLMRYLLRAF